MRKEEQVSLWDDCNQNNILSGSMMQIVIWASQKRQEATAGSFPQCLYHLRRPVQVSWSDVGTVNRAWATRVLRRVSKHKQHRQTAVHRDGAYLCGWGVYVFHLFHNTKSFTVRGTRVNCKFHFLAVLKYIQSGDEMASIFITLWMAAMSVPWHDSCHLASIIHGDWLERDYHTCYTSNSPEGNSVLRRYHRRGLGIDVWIMTDILGRGLFPSPLPWLPRGGFPSWLLLEKTV